MDNIKNFLKKEKIKYKDLELYKIAFTHSSYSNESNRNEESYERLEFLGDSVLGHVVAEHLYKNFNNFKEGDMTLVKHHLVSGGFIGEVAKKLEFEKMILLGAGEKNNELAFSIYGDLFESLVAAIYLDIGYIEAKKFIDKYITSEAKNIPLKTAKDSKTTLQELLQGEGRGTVNYKTYETTKNKSSKEFHSKVIFEEKVLGEGFGTSKKEAEKQAAKSALERMVK